MPAPPTTAPGNGVPKGSFSFITIKPELNIIIIIIIIIIRRRRRRRSSSNSLKSLASVPLQG